MEGMLEAINRFCWEERDKLVWYGFVCTVSPTFFNIFYSLYALGGTALYKQNIQRKHPNFSLEQDKLKFKLSNKDVSMDLSRSFDDSINMQFASMLHRFSIQMLGNEGIAISLLYCYWQYSQDPKKYTAIEGIASLFIADDLLRFLAVNLYSNAKELYRSCNEAGANMLDVLYKYGADCMNKVSGVGYGLSR